MLADDIRGFNQRAKERTVKHFAQIDLIRGIKGDIPTRHNYPSLTFKNLLQLRDGDRGIQKTGSKGQSIWIEFMSLGTDNGDIADYLGFLLKVGKNELVDSWQNQNNLLRRLHPHMIEQIFIVFHILGSISDKLGL